MNAGAAKARMAVHRAASEAVSAVLSPGAVLQVMLGAAGMPYWLSGLLSSAIPLAWAAPQALASRGLGRLAGSGRILASMLLSGEAFLMLPFRSASSFISPRRVKPMTGCFLLPRPMARRPGLARSAARGISTGVTSRGTPGRAVEGGQPVPIGLWFPVVRLGFRRSPEPPAAPPPCG
jgi:hypothetical protein